MKAPTIIHGIVPLSDEASQDSLMPPELLGKEPIELLGITIENILAYAD